MRLRALDPTGTWRVERSDLSPGLRAPSSRIEPAAVAAELRAALG